MARNATLLPIAVLFTALLYSRPVVAEWSMETYNPQPNDADVSVPMPCGGTMVFRRVNIPSIDPVDDKRIVIGGLDERFSHIEGLRADYISGTFDNPARSGERYYLIGKYEVSQRQYRALHGDCKAQGDDDSLPQTKVSWFEAVHTADTYTQWLLKNGKQFKDKTEAAASVMRLPTEAEWEFAVRGGSVVSESNFAKKRFPMPDGIAAYVWFEGQKSASGEIQPVGLLKPNPLGLFDMLGNVDELMLEPFRLNKAGRLHGQAGGALLKGGNYLTSERDVRSAYRQEMALYNNNGLKRSSTTGFRLVVSKTVMSSPARLREIRAAWDNLPRIELDASGKLTREEFDPVAALTGLKAELGGNEESEKKLARVVASIRNSVSAQNEQIHRAAKSALRLGAFLVRKVTEDHRRVNVLSRLVALRKNVGADEKTLAKLESNLSENKRVMMENVTYLSDTVVEVAQEYSAATVAQQLTLLSAEFESRDLAGLIPSARHFAECTASYRKKGEQSHQTCVNSMLETEQGG